MNDFDQNSLPPQVSDEAAVSLRASPERLQSVARARLLVGIAVLLYTLVILFHIATKMGAGGHTPLPIGILIFGMFAAGRLAYALDGTRRSLLYCLAIPIPGVGFLALLFLDWRATSFLKENGARISLWGYEVRPAALHQNEFGSLRQDG